MLNIVSPYYNSVQYNIFHAKNSKKESRMGVMGAQITGLVVNYGISNTIVEEIP